MKQPFNINLNNVDYIEADSHNVLIFKMTNRSEVRREYKNRKVRDYQQKKLCKAMNSNLYCGDVI